MSKYKDSGGNNKNKFYIATVDGKNTKKEIQFVVCKNVKKITGTTLRLFAAFLIVVTTICLKTLAEDNYINNNILNKEVYGTINSSNEFRTETDNILSTVNIQAFGNDFLETGTGVIMKITNEELLILTARHVVTIDDKPMFVVRFADNSETIATVKSLSSDDDWAILSIPIDNVPLSVISTMKPVVFETEDPKNNENVYNIRSHYIDGIYIYNGKIIDTKSFNIRENRYGTGTFIKTNYNVLEGASGGGLFNENGHLIGISSQTAINENTSLFCNIQDILQTISNF